MCGDDRGEECMGREREKKKKKKKKKKGPSRMGMDGASFWDSIRTQVRTTTHQASYFIVVSTIPKYLETNGLYWL